MKVTFLGSGTSTGVPIIGCDCPVCHSSDPRDKRQRFSISVQKGHTTIIIDTGPDFRNQAIQNNIKVVDAVLYTHCHYDHVGGINDLRAFTLKHGNSVQVWLDKITYKTFKRHYPYFFHSKIPGQLKLSASCFTTKYQLKKYFLLKGKKWKNFLQHTKVYHDFYVKETHIQPIRLLHIPTVHFESVGFVKDRKLGYLTDFKLIFPLEYDKLKHLDTLILGTPRFETHPTHISIKEAIELFKRLNPKLGIIGHLGHDVKHATLLAKLPKNIIPAYDGFSLTV